MKAFGWTRVLRAAAIVTGLFDTSVAASQTLALDAARQPIGDADGLGDLSARIVAAEGGPKRNPLSSAAGYGQFLSGTWLEMFERAYPQVAQTMTREQILALRDIKPLAEDLTNRYAQANAAMLRGVGLPATAGELSLAHAIGPRGAVSVLTAEPARPAAELLRPEATAANPFLREMTASALRQWATIRVNLPTEGSPESAAARIEPPFEPPRPAEDFGIDDRTKASQALVTNHSATALLQDLVDAWRNTRGGSRLKLRQSTASWLISVGVDPTGLFLGEPTAVRVFNRNASRIVLEAVRETSSRSAYREFKAIEAHARTHGELQPDIARALAIALLDKMRQENKTITDILQHRRSAAAARPSAISSAPHPLRDAANAQSAAAGGSPL